MKIAIAGYGIEGEASYRYWNTSDNQVVIVDEQQPARGIPTDASVIVGEDAYNKLKGYDIVVRTAGLAPHKIKTDGKVWSATNEFFAQCPAPIIGVTGTKGKGTTSSLITSILRAAGKTVHLLGNIGEPALAKLPDIQEDDLVVYELSSFQLWDVEKSPHIAVVLLIEPDHLDVHSDFDDYVAAKAHIAAYQQTTDRIVYYAPNEIATTIAKQSVGQLLPYPIERGVHAADGYFWHGESQICSIDNLLLVGSHNIENACAAITAVWPWVQDGEVIAEGLRGFDGLPHRLKFVREVKSVSYYDDSIATTPGSAIAAVRAFSVPKVLILGGSSKGSDYHELAEVVASEVVRHVIAIGDEAAAIKAALNNVGYESIALLGSSTTMSEVVGVAASAAEAGDVVILSPACASFGMFKNYTDRGDQFIAAVTELSGE